VVVAAAAAAHVCHRRRRCRHHRRGCCCRRHHRSKIADAHQQQEERRQRLLWEIPVASTQRNTPTTTSTATITTSFVFSLPGFLLGILQGLTRRILLLRSRLRPHHPLAPAPSAENISYLVRLEPPEHTYRKRTLSTPHCLSKIMYIILTFCHYKGKETWQQWGKFVLS
jgi:hypothetical protein